MLNWRIDSQFFDRHQRTLLWLANTRIGRRYWRIRHPVSARIVRIRPNHIVLAPRFDLSRKQWVQDWEFRTSAGYALRLAHSLRWLKLLPFIVTGLAREGHSLIPAFALTSYTFYPDAHPETTSVDGWARRTVAAQTWVQIHDGVGNSATDTDASERFYMLSSDGASSYDDCTRSFFLFDSSSIPDTATIISASISLVGTAKTNTNGINTTTWGALHICATTPASNTAIAAGDYANTSSTSFGSISYSAFNTDGATYNNIALNASGIAQVSLTGISKFGGKSEADIANGDPGATGAGATKVSGIYADTAGTSTDPKLTVVTGITLTVTETLNLTDTVIRSTTKIFTEVLTLTEAFIKSVSRAFTESMTFADLTAAIGRILNLTKTESLSLTETQSVINMWTKRTKPTTAWTDRTEPTSAWTNRTEPTTPWT